VRRCNEAAARRAGSTPGQPWDEALAPLAPPLRRAVEALAPGASASAGGETALLEQADDVRVLVLLPRDDGAAADHAAFGYTVSHDLRAPLRVVEGFTRIVQEDYGRLLDRIGNDHLERVLAAAARMHSMIDALLALAQLSAQPLAHQPVDLSQLAGFVVDDLRRQQPERQVEVHVEPGLMARGDPTLLRIALENLLGNAWKYSAKARQPRIALETAEHEGRRVYVVRDNGAGFDMRFVDRLFGVFQRLHSANDYQGTGIGLASVRRIVRRHGGDIWAEGEVGRGARFYFTLD
jgi:light-regulated signal transduction histidine kinase (bacteriophytochrome)